MNFAIQKKRMLCLSNGTYIYFPWQLAQSLLQAASIPFTTKIEKNYNRFFSISSEECYVGRVIVKECTWEIVLFHPMVASHVAQSSEVQYAKKLMEEK